MFEQVNPVFVIGVLALLAVSLWAVLFRRPDLLKPQWLRDEEQRRRREDPLRVVFVGDRSMLGEAASAWLQSLCSTAPTKGYDVYEVEPSPAGLDLPCLGPSSMVVVATLGRCDEDAIRAALCTRAGYIALGASAERGAAVLRALRESGFGEHTLARVRLPEAEVSDQGSPGPEDSDTESPELENPDLEDPELEEMEEDMATARALVHVIRLMHDRSKKAPFFAAR